MHTNTERSGAGKKALPVRKIVLLCAIAVLLVIYILQLLFSARSSAKVVTTDAEIDTLSVTKGDESLYTITKSVAYWYYEYRPLMENRANGLVNSVKEISLLGTVTSNTNDLERYGLDHDNAVTVTALSGGKAVRVLKLGKISATGSQCYVMLDDGSNVYLARGALRSTFDVDINTLLEPEETEEQAAEPEGEGGGVPEEPEAADAAGGTSGAGAP